ncbi:stAR-related lipid transfer protein 4 isoform X2 [Equus przewalskii]|uniref:StAR-related lipid transfer protein 4 isoform X2 n=1 Tax=Equus przewalskii TaxID=9798 RepID=A0ABM4KGU0_EQUPR
MEGLPDAAAFATKLKNTLIQYHSIEDDKWRVVKKTKDVTIWRKPSEEFNGHLFKAQGVIDDVVNSVIDHIRPGPCRLDWDSLMTSLDILEHFEENCCVMRYTTAGQLLNIISPREFVDFSYTVGYKEGLLSCGTKYSRKLNGKETGWCNILKFYEANFFCPEKGVLRHQEMFSPILSGASGAGVA